MLRETHVRRPLAAQVRPLFERAFEGDVLEPHAVEWLVGIVKSEQDRLVRIFEEAARSRVTDIRLDQRVLVQDLRNANVRREILALAEDRRLAVADTDLVRVLPG